MFEKQFAMYTFYKHSVSWVKVIYLCLLLLFFYVHFISFFILNHSMLMLYLLTKTYELYIIRIENKPFVFCLVLSALISTLYRIITWPLAFPVPCMLLPRSSFLFFVTFCYVSFSCL